MSYQHVVYDRRRKHRDVGNSERARAVRDYIKAMRDYRAYAFVDPEYAHGQWLYAQSLKASYNL